MCFHFDDFQKHKVLTMYCVGMYVDKILKESTIAPKYRNSKFYIVIDLITPLSERDRSNSSNN